MWRKTRTVLTVTVLFIFSSQARREDPQTVHPLKQIASAWLQILGWYLLYATTAGLFALITWQLLRN